MSRRFTAGTINHKNSFDEQFRKEFNTRFIDEDRELAEATLRAERHNGVTEDLRARDLKLIAAELKTEHTHMTSWADLGTFIVHLNSFEENFERVYSNMTSGNRDAVKLYASSLATSMINLKVNSAIAFKVLKRLAIRLGLTKYTAHF